MTQQHPLNSGFDAYSTAMDVIAGVNLSGKVAIVTGGHSNLGLEAARVLAGAGAHVIVPTRSEAGAVQAKETIPGVETATMDLMDPASIDAFAEDFLSTGRSLDILLNSAGIMATPLARDASGNESQLSTNHLGHFRLTSRLWPALVAAKGARVVSVSSRGHQIAGIDFDDVNFDRRDYDKWVAYGQSKTANVLFAIALDERGAQHGVRAYSLHPGSVLGPLARHLTDEEIDSFGARHASGEAIVAPDRDMKSTDQGASTLVWCASSPLLRDIGGVYCENSDVARVMPEDAPERFGVFARAIDPEIAERLWALSVDMTGVDIPKGE
ncbi:oxidoreductase [Sphingomonas aurantiaca]|uniref:oxidoreductase n=1 Tax=Sphingomonas aurantiaca TaxID=185949 RepID=UPI00334FB341